MGTWIRRIIAAGVLTLGYTTFGEGCVQVNSMLFIRQCQVMNLEDCTVDSTTSSLFRPYGRFDPLYASQYGCSLLVGNQLVPRADVAKMRVETSRVQILGADVILLDAEGKAITRADGTPAQYFTPSAGFIDPASGVNATYGLTYVLMIDPATAADLAATVKKSGTELNISASVQIRARTLGGDQIVSAPWEFPIHVCYGCLCKCPGPDSTATVLPGCSPGVDEAMDCRNIGGKCLDPSTGL